MVQANLSSFAIAIFEIAKDKNTQNIYYQQIQQLDKLNNDNPDLAKILSSVTIPKIERKNIAKDILSQLDFDKNLIYWVWTIIDANQYQNFHLIANQCTLVHHAIFNIIKVEITSANELNRNQLAKITNFFSDKLKAEIDLKLKIQPDLIGGLKIQINNKTYNNTFKSKLNELKTALLNRKDR